LYGVEVPEVMDGIAIGQRVDTDPRYATSVARLGAVQSVRLGTAKLNFNWSGVVRVYDTESDPEEQTDLYDSNDPLTQELWSLMLPYAQAADPLVNEFPMNIPAALAD
jgi:hypothetical protein